MNILVTGATGFLGQEVVLEARRNGHRVLVCSRGELPKHLVSAGAVPLILPGWPSQVDVSSSVELLTQAGGINCIIHLAGDASYGNGDHYQISNVLPTQGIADIVKFGFPAARLVFASSVGAQDYQRLSKCTVRNELNNPNPLSDYGKSKLACEMLISQEVPNFVNARLGMIIGPEMRENSHLKALLGVLHNPIGRLFLSRLAGTMPLIDVKDAAAGLLHLCDESTAIGTYLVVDRNIRIADIAAAAFQKPAKRLTINLGRFASLLPAKLAPSFGPIMSFSNAKLLASGWKPTSKIEATIEAVNSKIVQPWGAAFVTGVGSGLGRAVFETLNSDGLKVIGVDVDESSIDQLKTEFPHQTFLVGDVRDANLFESAASLAGQHGLRIDSVFLVAGVGTKIDFADQLIENVKQQFEINVLARLNITSHFLSHVRDLRIKSRIVIVSSSSALQPLPGFSTYCASNAALLSFGRSLSMEVDPKDCHVVTVVPGGMDTRFQERAGVKRLKNEKLLSPYSVADAAVAASKRGSSVLVIGRNARVTQLLTRVLPMRTSDWLWARVTKVAR